MKIVLIGIQGAGKSTQGNRIAKEYDLAYLSSGHIFREMAKEKTPWGRYVKETLNAGVLMPDDKTVDVVNEYLSKPEYANGYILDGFPRTLNQAKMFQNGLDKVIYLKVSDKEAVWRLFGRIDEDVRQDNTLEAIRKRISLFHELTVPVIEYYRGEGKLAEIDGERSIEEIYSDIKQILDPLR